MKWLTQKCEKFYEVVHGNIVTVENWNIKLQSELKKKKLQQFTSLLFFSRLNYANFIFLRVNLIFAHTKKKQWLRDFLKVTFFMRSFQQANAIESLNNKEDRKLVKYMK